MGSKLRRATHKPSPADDYSSSIRYNSEYGKWERSSWAVGRGSRGWMLVTAARPEWLVRSNGNFFMYTNDTSFAGTVSELVDLFIALAAALVSVAQSSHIIHNGVKNTTCWISAQTDGFVESTADMQQTSHWSEVLDLWHISCA